MKRKVMSILMVVALLITSNLVVYMPASAETRSEIQVTESDNYVKFFYLSGYNSASAVTKNGDLYCWGKNEYGEVGNGTTEDQTTPVKVLENVEDIFPRNGNNTAITTNGDLYCWGRNGYGQVGNGSTGVQTTPVKILENVKNFFYDNLFDIVAALTANGDLYCWGDNSGGAVGNGSEENQTTPIKILENVENVFIDYDQIAAVTTNGDLYCWENNYGSRDGYGSTPVKILENVENVFIDGYGGAAVTTKGDLYCWGDNKGGQVGNGSKMYQTTPVKILENVENVFTRSYWKAAITKNGDLYCWGNNDYGEVGNGTTEDQTTPVKILENVENVFTRSNWIAAITKNGDLYCWGDNDYGQVGNGTTENQTTPVKILENVENVLVCSSGLAVITRNNDLYCWGKNTYGEVGNGSREDQTTPVKILENVENVFTDGYTKAAITKNGDLYWWGLEASDTPVKILENVENVFLDISNGTAITKNGELYCWGSNWYGQIGNGTTQEQHTPTRINLSSEDLPQQQNIKNNVYYINSVDSNQIILDALSYGYDDSKVPVESLQPYIGKYAYIEFDTSISPKVIGIKAVKSSIGTITEYVELNSSGGNDSIEVDHKEYQVSNKSTSIIDGRNSRILYHTIDDKIVGIEFLKTSIGYYNGTTVDGERTSITVSDKKYDINSASCISDKIENGKLVVFSVGTKNNSDEICPFLLEMQELQGTPSVWVYVSDDTFSTEIGQELDLYCALHIDNYVIPDWGKPSFAVGNDKLVTLSNYEQTDLGYHCKIKGVSVGQTTLTITDTETGAHQSFLITVKEKSETMSYTCRINEVPDYTIESGWDKGLQTNIYNVNGLYVNKYKYEKNEAGGYDVSFDVYNTLYMHGSVDVYDKDGRWIQSAKINKRTGITSLYTAGESLVYLIDDALQQKSLTYEATTYTKKTGIKISVPEDGYFVISTNYADSPGVMLYNSIDIIVLGLESIASGIDEIDYNLNLEKYLSNVKEKQLHEVLQDSIESKTKKFLSDQLKEGMTAGYGEAANAIVLQGNEILTAEKLDENFYKDVFGVGGDVLQNYMGPAGAGLKVVFGIEKYTDYTIQVGQICKGISKSEIVISTVSAPTIHGITVKPENSAAVGEAVLQIFRVSEREDIASSFENAIAAQTNQYEIYNICFTKDNVEQEINTNVTVRIPIPKAFDKNKSAVYRQEKDGSWTRLDSRIDGSYLVFETNHFSLYAIADSSAGDETTAALISSITLNMKNGAVTKSGSLKLNAAIAPSNAANQTLLWSSDTPSVATVDQTGLVTAVRVGRATITAKAQDGSGVEASCVVEVTDASDTSGGSSGGGSSSDGDSSDGGSSSSGGSSGGGSSSSAGGGNTSITDETIVKVLYYIVNFNKNGGKNLSRQKMTLLQDDSLGILPKVERKNYKFLGWYTQPVNGTKVNQKTVLNVSTTLYARWGKVIKPSKEQITSLKSEKAGTMVVKYKKYSGVKGYEIVYSTSKKFTAASTIRAVAGSAEKTLKKLKSGKTYYVKVRAYKIDSTGRRIYGAYSKVRNVRVK